MSKKSRKTVVLKGKVLASNISPKGHVEGVLIETSDGIVQLNFPKHDHPAMVVGSVVDVLAELEDEGDHLVYRAASSMGCVTGTVARLNYALHGEVNGYQLGDGTFVHVKPEGAKHYKLRVGDEITVKGSRRPGTVVVEAELVTKTKERART